MKTPSTSAVKTDASLEAGLLKGLPYPWQGLTPGLYITESDCRDVSIEVIDGRGDFEGQLMFRWAPNTIPGRLLHELPKVCLLRRP